MRIPVMTAVMRRCGNVAARMRMRGRSPSEASVVAEARAIRLRRAGDLVAAETWFRRAAWKREFRSVDQRRLCNEAARCAVALAETARDPVTQMEWWEAAARNVADRQLEAAVWCRLAAAKGEVARQLLAARDNPRALRQLVKGGCPSWLCGMFLKLLSQGAVTAAEHAAQARAELAVQGLQDAFVPLPVSPDADLAALAAECAAVSRRIALDVERTEQLAAVA